MVRSAIFCIWKGLSCSLVSILVFPFISFSQNAIATENSLPGNPYSEWGVPDFRDNRIAGFANKMSLNRGQTVRFKINVQSSASYTLRIYRIGYYGGNGARLMANLGTLAGTVQPNGISNSSTGHLDCSNWSESASWVIPSTAVSGFYIAKLERSGGGSNHIAFIVRNDASNSALYLQFPDATWQAYNGYGGNTMYDGNTSWPSGHAVKVSYNRPFFPYNSLFNTDGRQADWYMNATYPMIRWLERNGYDVTYTCSNDVARNGNRLLNHKVFVTLGHDEYVSKDQRNNIEAARDAGVHLAFFTGNEVYWKTRWENSDGSEDRTLVCYKEGLWADGSLAERVCGYKCDVTSPEWTGLWRTGENYDAGLPENGLTGQISWTEYPAEIGVPAFYKNLRFWRNTAVATLLSGQTAFLGNSTLGYEWDYEQPPYASSYPEGRFTMSSRTVGGLTHKLSLYRHSSGALVFGAGTVQWSWGLDGQHWGGTTTTSPEMQQATVNLFADMGVQPGTLQSGLVAASESTDNSPPTTTLFSPSNGASFSTDADITFSGAASDGGGVVASVEISMDGGSTWTPTTITNIASSTTWTYTWIAVPNGTYNIRARGIDDSGNKGNPSSPITITVGAGGGDLIPPTVSSVSPSNGATGVSVNTTVIANFSEPVSGASVTSSTYQLRNAANNLITATLNTSGSQITLFPTSALSPSTTYTVTITGGSSGVKDLAGNALVNNYSWTFTTSSGGGGGSVTLFPPSSAPAGPPANDEQGIALGMRFRTTQNGFISGIRYYKGAGTTGTHTGQLWTNTGTQLAQATFTNETASGWQQVLFSSPVAVTAGVTYVASYFSPSGDYCATKPFFTQAVVNGPIRGLADGEDGPNGLYRYTATAAFPNSSFQSSNYWVDVVFNTSSGSDVTPPTVSSVSPLSGATGVSAGTTVVANFSEVINSATVTGTTFQLRGPGTNLVTASVTTSGSQITLTPSAALTGSTLYTVTIVGGSSGVKDLAGNALASNYTWSFTTASVDNTPPTVTTVSPASGATGMSATTNAVANFSEAINSSTVTGSTFQLRDVANNLVLAAISTSGNQITLNPSASLAAGATYTATIIGGATGVKDLAGNALASNFTWSFTTASVDNTPPTVTTVSPSNGATGISVSSTVVANFSEAINSSTVTGSTYQLRNASNVLITATVSASGSQITLSPSVALTPSTTYTATITGGASGVKDLAGNALANNFSWSFTTAASGGGGSTFTVFQVTNNPAEPLANDGQSIELGMKFRSTQNGFITGIRYYKEAGTTGTHTGSLWTNTGTRLAQATFTNETASGWQQILFGTPVAITAGVTYVASYFSPSGDYAATNPYFTQAVVNGALRGLANGEDGPNGLYRYTTISAFPNSSFESTNYWVDVVFNPSSGGIAPTVTAHPATQTVCAGNNVTFTSAASGTPAPTVQWQQSTNGTTWTNISGATSGTLTFNATTADNSKQYRAVWTNSSGSVNSNPATLTVNSIPVEPVVTVVNNCGSSTLTASSFTGSLLWNTGATTASITVTAVGTYTVTQTVNGCISPDGSGVAAPKAIPALSSSLTATATSSSPFSYTATSSTPGTTFVWSRSAVTGISNGAATGNGNISETLVNTTALPVNVTYVYTLTASGCTNTQNVVVTVGANGSIVSPAVTAQPASQTRCPGLNASFSSAASGSPAPTVQWQVSANGTSWTNISGATNATLSFATAIADNNKQYRAVWTNSGGTVNSNAAILTVNATPVAPVVTVVNNCGSSLLTASGYTGNLLWSNGATTASITVSAAGTYAVTQTVNGCTSPARTGIAAPKATPPALNVAVTNNCGSSILAVSGYIGSLLWSNGAATSSISVNTAGTFTITQTANGCTSTPGSGTAAPKTIPSAPNVVVSNNCGNSVLTATDYTGTLLWSNGATASSITVTTAGTFTVRQTVNGCTSTPGSGTAAPKATPSAPNVAVANNCGNSVLTATGAPGASFLWSTGASTSSITITTAGTYTVTQTVSGCTSPPRSSVAAPKPIPALTSSLTATATSSSAFSYTATSSTAGTTFAWSRASVTGISNGAATGNGNISETLVNTTASPVNVTYVYTLTANGCTNTQNVVVTVGVDGSIVSPAVTTQPASQTKCTGLNVSFSSAASGSPAPTVQWEESTNGTSWNNITGATTSILSFTTTAGDNSKQYRAVWTNSSGSVNSNPATLTVNSIPVAPVVTVVNNCGSSTLTASSFTGSLLWNTGATTASITVTAAGTYTVSQTVNGCISPDGSGVAAPKAIPALSSSLTATATSSSAFSYTATSSTAGTTFAWSRAAVTGISNGAATGNGNISETLVNTTASPVNVTYVYTLTASGCTNTQNVVVSVGVDGSIVSPAVTAQPASQTRCPGLNASFSSAASGSPAPTVQWQVSANGTTWTNITGATNATLSFATATADNNKQYRAVWTNSGGTVNSNAAILTVNATPVAPVVSVVNNCGSSLLTASGYTGTLLWSNGATTASITVSTAGTYAVAQTVNGCTSPISSGVAAPKAIPALSSSLTATATSSSPFSYTATSSTPGTTFVWSRSAVTGISNGAATGNGNISETLVNTTALPVNVTYVYTLTASGCTNTQNVVVTVGANGSIVSPAVTAQPASQTRCPGLNASFSSAASGSPAPTVQWQVSTNGTSWTNISGATNATLSFATATADNNKQYRAVWTNSGGTVNSNAAILTVNATPVAPVVTVVNNCGSSLLTASGYTGNLLWSNGATTASITVSAAGTYAVTQTVNGCTSPARTGIAAPKATPPALNVAVTNNCGSSILAVSGYIGSLLWSNGAATSSISVNTAGTFTITQTANGCTSTPGSGTAAPKTIPSAPNVVVSNNCGNSVLTATDYTGTLLWSNGATASSITVTTAGTFTVRQTVNGCTSTPGSGTAAPKATPSAPNVAVANNCGNSVLTATGAPGASFLWSTGASTSSITITTAGTYTVTQTVSGCTSPPRSSVAAPKPIPALTSSLTATATSSSAFSYTATSSTAGTTFAWSRASVTGISNGAATGNGNISETLVNTTASPVNVTYVYTLTANGCTNTQNVVVTVGVDGSIVSPAVTTQPASQTKCTGLNVSFSSAASGSPAPTVQWEESTNGTSWNNITGATTSILSFTTTAGDNNKQYRAVWTNIAGTTTSNAATLIVSLIPAAPGVSVTNNCGSSLLTATGAPGATFLWSNGATTDAITVTTIGTYTVNQTVNNCTSAEGSGVAAPKPIPALTSSLTATATSSSAFNYTATSSTAGTTFAWSRAAVTGISNGAATGNGNISETLVNTTASPVNVTYVYTLTADGCTNTQNVVVTVGVDGSIVSPAVTTQPASQTKCAGLNVIFSSAASGGPAPTVQWEESTNGTSWNNITGATTSILSFTTTAEDNNKQYRAVWTNIAGTTTSNAATLIVSLIPAAPGVSVTNNCGSSLLTATGAPGATFLWSNGATTDAITVTTIGTYTVNQTVNNCTSAEGTGVAAPKPIPALTSSLTATATSSSAFNYTATSSTAGTTFAWSRAAVTGISNGAATGNGNISETLVNTTASPVNVTYVYTLTADGCTNTQNVVVTVGVDGSIVSPAVTTQPASQTKCAGLNVIFSSAASGGPAPTVQWEESTNGTSWNNITGATTSILSFTTTAGDNNKQYRAVWTNIAGTTTSNAATLIVSLIPAAPEVSVTNNCGSSLLTATGAPGATFLWSNGVTTDAITVTTNGTYTVNQTVNNCTSAEGTGVAAPKPIPALTSGLTATATSSSALNYTATSSTAGTTFAWSRAAVTGISNGAATGNGNISETLVNTTASPVNVTYVYTLTADGCTNTQNVVVTVGVDGSIVSPAVTTQPASQTKCAGLSVSFSSAASGSPVPTVQWEESTNGTNWNNITGATTSTLSFTTSAGDNNKQYRAVWTNIAGTATSNAALLIVNTIPAAPGVSVTNNCGSSLLTATGAPGAIFSWSNGATTDAISVMTNGTYSVNQTVNNCTSAEGSGVAAPKPIPALTSSLTATATSSSAFSYTATSSTSGTTFAWSRAAVTGISNGAATGNGNINETLVNITASPVNVTYVYTLTADGCINTQNVVVIVSVDESIVSPVLTTQPASQTKCAGLNVSFSSAASGSPSPTVQWQESTNGTSWNNITGATASTLSFTTTAADNNKQYRAVWTNSGGSVNSNGATVMVNSIPSAPSISVADNCGNSVLTATGVPEATFLWSNGAASNSITVPAGTYTVTQTVNDCTGPPHSSVTAPRTIPVLSSNLSATATSGTAFTYTAASTTAGTTFAWTREEVAGISNAAGNGTGNINESLVNTTTLPVNVTYVYILTADGCNNAQNVVVTVNPVATVNCTINGSSMVADFNSTEVPAGRFIWFNSSFDPGSLGTGTNTVTMNITNTVISFTANSQQYILNVPDGRIRFDASALTASTQFVNGIWETVVPHSYTSHIFMSGLSYQVPVNFPGSISNVRWTANVSIDRINTSIDWRWSAAVYTTFASHSAIDVKPIDGSTLNPYPNSDDAGTPENFKTSLVIGARGTGGTNYTGNYVNSGSITCSTIETRPAGEPFITKKKIADRLQDLVTDRLPDARNLDARVMPNPSSTFFNLVIKGSNDSPVTIKIMDIFGRIVERHDRIAANTVLKVGDRWTDGSYYVEVVQGSQRKVIQIIKAR